MLCYTPRVLRYTRSAVCAIRPWISYSHPHFHANATVNMDHSIRSLSTPLVLTLLCVLLAYQGLAVRVLKEVGTINSYIETECLFESFTGCGKHPTEPNSEPAATATS